MKVRICLLLGLIMSTIIYAANLVGTCISIVGLFALLGGDSTVFNAAIFMTAAVMIFTMIFCLLGLIFSAVSFKRVSMEPQKFEQNKGMLITVVVFDILVALLLCYGFVEGISATSVIYLVALIASVVLIIVDIARNKKLLTDATVSTADLSVKQSTAEVSGAENKEEVSVAENKTDTKS